MLFDIKGRRKRAIQVTYVVLAILFGGGLVLFGVGSNVQGGLLDAIQGTGGSNAGSSFARDEVKRYSRLVQVNPKNERAWAGLARAQNNDATTGGSFDTNTGQFSEGAVAPLTKATTAWERYLKLKPRKPDSGVATFMVQAYAAVLRFSTSDSAAIDLFRKAGRAEEIIAKARPSPISYFNLAAISYQIGDIEKGDKAGDKALALTPKDQRNTVKSQIADARKQGLTQKKQLKKSEKQAAEAAKKARESGQDPFGTPPGQAPFGQ
jgi:tetratricopeptide (TPR) repeat protein